MSDSIHFYLDESGYEIDKAEFNENIKEGWNTGYVLYVGGGFVPLQVAVLTFREDISSCYSAFEDWCRRNDRLDEIGEDEPDSEFFGEYENFFSGYKV